MRIMSYNILKSGHGREHLLAEVIRHYAPDLVMLEESPTRETLERIALAAEMPYFDCRRGCSTAFMSRLPVTYRWQHVLFARSPFLAVQPDNSAWTIWGVHLLALLSNITELVRYYEIQALLRFVTPTEPHLLIGDFNTLAPGEPFDMTTFPPRLKTIVRLHGNDIRRLALKRLQDAGYVDTFRQHHTGENGWTMPSHQPNTRLDYAFVPKAFLPHIRDCRTLTEPDTVRRASDHLPILVDIEV